MKLVKRYNTCEACLLSVIDNWFWFYHRLQLGSRHEHMLHPPLNVWYAAVLCISLWQKPHTQTNAPHVVLIYMLTLNTTPGEASTWKELQTIILVLCLNILIEFQSCCFTQMWYPNIRVLPKTFEWGREMGCNKNVELAVVMSREICNN